MSKKNIYILFLISTTILFIFTGTLFLKNFQKLKKSGHFNGSQMHTTQVVPVDNIQTWMTFDYLNRTFGLPTDYLKNRLMLESSKYPKITLKRASLLTGKSSADIINLVQENIKEYNASQKNSTP